MAHHSRVLAGSFLLCWIGMPLSAEIVPISITQQVSVSGLALACDPLCQEFGIGLPESGQTFSSSNTNSDLPPTNLSAMGQATDFDAGVFNSGVRTASSEAGAGQSSVALTPSNIQVNLSGGYQFSGNATLQEGAADAYSQYLLTFDLNSPSLVHLTGSLNEETFVSGPVGPFGSFQGEILLTGPVAPFQAILPYTNEIMQIDTSFALGPGVYTLDAVSELDVDQTYFIDSISGLDVSLNADFTAIAEPKLMSPVLAFPTLAGIYFLRKHPQSCLRR